MRCHFGTDIDSEENLIANQISIDGDLPEDRRRLRWAISASKDLKKACHTEPDARFCTGCFYRRISG